MPMVRFPPTDKAGQYKITIRDNVSGCMSEAMTLGHRSRRLLRGHLRNISTTSPNLKGSVQPPCRTRRSEAQEERWTIIVTRVPRASSWGATIAQMAVFPHHRREMLT